MKQQPIIKLITTAVCSLALGGCITNEETVHRDVVRTKVEFENEAAARIFYEALSHCQVEYSHTDSTTEIKIPVIFDHKRRVVSGGDAAFNEAVKEADTNQDGKITELEARIFAQRHHG